MRILVMRGGALGDFVLTLPVLAALRTLQPSPHITILGYPRLASLAVAGNLAEDVHAIESPSFTPFFIPNGSLGETAVRFFASFSLIVSYLHDPERIFQSNISRCTSARFIAGPSRPDQSLDHAANQFLRPLEALGLFNANPQPTLVLPGSSEAKNRLVSGRWLALHPGSGSESKNWPEKSWGALLEELTANTAWNFFLIGGEAEGDRLTRLAAKLPSDRFQLASSLPLVSLAQHLKHCEFFVGHDSGISHLAASLGLPGLVLWAETIEKVWRPQSSKIKILRDPRSLYELPVNSVVTEINTIAAMAGRKTPDSHR